MTPPRRFCCDEDLALLAYDGLNAEADLTRWRDAARRDAEFLAGSGFANRRAFFDRFLRLKRYVVWNGSIPNIRSNRLYLSTGTGLQ